MWRERALHVHVMICVTEDKRQQNENVYSENQGKITGLKYGNSLKRVLGKIKY